MGGEGKCFLWSCIWDIPGFIFFLEFFIALAPLFNTKEENWVFDLLVLQKACIMHVTQTHSQTIKRAFEPYFCTEDLRHVQCLLHFFKMSYDLWHHWWSSHMVERRNLVMFPHKTPLLSHPASSLFSLCCCIFLSHFHCVLMVSLDSENIWQLVQNLSMLY